MTSSPDAALVINELDKMDGFVSSGSAEPFVFDARDGRKTTLSVPLDVLHRSMADLEQSARSIWPDERRTVENRIAALIAVHADESVNSVRGEGHHTFVYDGFLFVATDQASPPRGEPATPTP